VCWRLAKLLVAEYNCNLRLWVDDLDTFNRLCAADGITLSNSTPTLIQGVSVNYWPSIWPEVAPADVVLETFGCQLPPAYIAAMAAREVKSCWLNLEYLSAEDWVGGCHGLPSPQPNGLQKYFFFPGFRPDTGGLLREAGLIARRRSFQQCDSSRHQFLERIGVNPDPNAALLSLFCYENSALALWLNTLSEGETSYHIVVPEGRIGASICAWLGRDDNVLGVVYRRGQVSIQFIPFLSQNDYDLLLWSCDFNVVRGEDSFVRAQWAGRPFLWHIYPQQDAAHLVKLDAFLEVYSAGLSAQRRSALVSCWHAWNNGEPPLGNSTLLSGALDLAGHAEQWCRHLEGQNNLAESLVQFYLNSV
jgi:uncharacterized repeat protein (TIGR03837 family)